MEIAASRFNPAMIEDARGWLALRYPIQIAYKDGLQLNGVAIVIHI